MLNLTAILEYGSAIMLVISILCIIVTIITEFTKEISFLNRIPTKLQVLVLSMVVCIVAFFAYICYANIPFLWYYLVAVICLSFIVALICSKGWEYLFEIIKRYYKKDVNDLKK